jgi:uncharacterized metal-binding protein YceD (DUF177 family)
MAKMNNHLDYKVNLNDFVTADTVVRLTLCNTFFENFEKSEILGGNVAVTTKLHKIGTLQILYVALQGAVRIVCDRCLDEFDQSVRYEGNIQLYNKQDADLQQDTDDEIIILNDNDAEINLSQYLYESVCLSLPLQRFHLNDSKGNSTCNPQMLAKLRELNSNLYHS